MNLWDKARVWLKVTGFSAIVLYLLVFVLKNTGADKQVTLWVWFNKNPTAPLLLVLPAAFILGILSTLLVRTTFRTLKQLRDMKRRKMEKEAAAIITRAAKLRVREQNAGRGFSVQSTDDAV